MLFGLLKQIDGTRTGLIGLNYGVIKLQVDGMLRALCFRLLAIYRARACMVDVGFTAAAVTKILPSIISRLSTS